MQKLDKRLDRIESAFDEVKERRGTVDRVREAESWARELHPAQFERFDKFFDDFNARHPELSGRELMIELSKDPRAIELAREETELIVSQFADRSGELQ